MKTIILTAVLSVFLAFPASANQEVVQIKGMVCDFCAQALNKVFLKEEAVESLDVNLDEQTFTILYKDGADALEEEKIKEMVYWAGYDFVGIRTPD